MSDDEDWGCAPLTSGELTSPMVAKAMRRFKLALDRRRMKEREMSIIGPEELAQIGELRRMRAKLAEAAAFLDRLAERIWRDERACLDCRAMAKKLRGET